MSRTAKILLRFILQQGMLPVMGMIFLGCPLAGQHMLEQRLTDQNGLATSETNGVAVDRLGYIWTTTTLKSLSRYDGRTFVNYPRTSTGGVNIVGLLPFDHAPDAFAYGVDGNNQQQLFLLRGDSIQAYPKRMLTGFGENLRDSSVILCGRQFLYLTVPYRPLIKDSVRVPSVTGYHLISARGLPNGGFHLKYVLDTDYNTFHYLYFDGLRGEPLLHHPWGDEEPWSDFYFPDGSYLNYGRKATDTVFHYDASGSLVGTWCWPLPPSSTALTMRVEGGQYYLKTTQSTTTSREEEIMVLRRWNPKYPAMLGWYGSFLVLNEMQMQEIAITDGTIWAPSHAGLRRMVPHSEAYISGSEDVIGSMHAMGQLANGDVYVGGYGTGFMRIRNRVPERLTEPPFEENYTILPGSFQRQDGGLLFIDENSSRALAAISPTGQLSHAPIDHSGGFATGFCYEKVDLPVDSNKKQAYLAMGMTNGRNDVEPHGRIGLLPLPFSIQDTVKTIGSNKGVRVTNVNCLAQDIRGRIWFGHANAGVGLYDPILDTAITWTRTLEGDPVALSMAIDQNDRLWLGTLKGLYYVDSVSQLPPTSTIHLRDYHKRCLIKSIPPGLVGSVRLLDAKTLIVSHKEGLSFLDLSSKDASQPRASTIPIQRYLGGSEQNALLVDQEGQIWVIRDRGIVRINYNEILRERRVPGKIDIAVIGDEASSRFVNAKEVSLPVGDRSLNYGYEIDVLDQVRNELRTEMLLLDEKKDTVSYYPALLSGRTVRENYLPPGKYQLIAQTFYDNLPQQEYQTVINVPRRLPEYWWFWPTLVGLVMLPAVIYLLYRNRLTKAALERKRLESERNRALLEASEARAHSERLQISTLSNAVNPHFISNALQWLSSAYLIGRPQESMDEMSHELARTIRTMFTNSTEGRVAHGLDEELQLVERYLRTVNIQYDERYTFELPTKACLKALQHYQVLLMQIQVHVENAVEHGLRYRPAGRVLRVSVQEVDQAVVIIIEDEGAGVAYVKERQQRQLYARKASLKGRGTTIMQQLQATFNRYNNNLVTTLVDSPIFTAEDGTPYGTRVTITVPKDYQYAIQDDRR